MVSSKLLLALGIFSSIGSALAQLSPRACTKTYTAKAGDTCASVSSAQGITVSQFLNSNPSVSSCELVTGTKYCLADDGSGGTTPDTPSLAVSTDGTCGNGITCLGSRFGNCCSEHGFCGDAEGYCGAGCLPDFGSCNGTSTPPVTTPLPSPGTSTVYVTSTITTTKVISTTNTAVTTRTTTVEVGATATTTATSVVLTTSVVSKTTTVGATATATSVILSTSIISRTVTFPVTSTAIATSTSYVVATSTSVLLTTSVRTSIVLSTSISISTSTLTSYLVATSTRVVTSVVIDERTATVTSTVTGACTTKPDAPITTSNPSAPSPLFPGSVNNCKAYDRIRSSDNCATLINRNKISYAQFYQWNPSVGQTNNLLGGVLCAPGLVQLLIDGVCKISCDDLWEGYYICVSA